ncbi:MAG: hypothetical protein ACSHX8_10025 [Opitutaceae bacterium]
MQTRTSSKNSGFALVIALSLMAFVLLLLLSITTLVQVEQSSASISKAQLQSKQNALLALNQALGTLQSEMGPDQRISANADLFDNSGTLRNDNSMNVAHPYLVGAWDTSGDNTLDKVEDRIDEKWTIGDSINYRNRTTNGFRRWLISSDGTLDTSNMALASDTSFRNSSDAFKALGVGTLEPNNTGDLSASVDPDKEIWVPLQDVTSDGTARIGWVVLDEGVKARMNQSHQLASKPSPTNSEKLEAWDNPGNIGIEAMGSSNEFANFDRTSGNLSKISSFADASFYMSDSTNSDNDGSVAADTFGPYYHDLSLYSAGVMADVVNGGLKRDLSTLAEEKPNDYMSRYIYSNTASGHSDNPNADPRWSAMLDYISLYKDNDTVLKTNTDIVGGLPVAQMTTSDWGDDNTGSRADIDSPLPAPETYRLAPAIAQFETFFSIFALRPHVRRYINADQSGEPFYPYYTWQATGNPAMNDPRMLNLCITPVITLYNPYNVPIEFGDLWVSFRDIPIGLRFSRLGLGGRGAPSYVPMTDDFVPLSTMNSYTARYRNELAHLNADNNKEQRFVMQLTSGEGGQRGAPADPTVLAPGESIVFSPDYPANTPLEDLVNWTSSEQYGLIAKPGYSDGVGLYWDALLPFDLENNDTFRSNETIRLEGYNTAGVLTTFSTTASFGLAQVHVNILDNIKIEMAFVDGSQNPQRATRSGNNGFDDPAELERAGTFSVELYSEDPEIGYPGQLDNSANKNLIGRYTFDYNTESLHGTSVDNRELLLDEGVAIGQQSSEDDRFEEDSRVVAQTDVAIELLHLSDVIREPGDNGPLGTVGDISPHVFGSFSVGGKVTTPTEAKPFQPGAAYAYTNTSVFSGHVHIGEESQAFSNYNLYINSPEDGVFDQTFAPQMTVDNAGFFFSGNSIDEGTQYGTQLEVPVTPLQSIASLQHANIAASGYLPQVSHAIGNSWAHPLIKSDEALTNGDNYNYFDHTYLGNTQLWDSYYFSTMADQRSALDSTGEDYGTTVSSFIRDGDALPNPTFKRHIPAGKDTATVTTELVNGSSVQQDAYLKAAAYQLQEGTFNINSTSVEAWKAILATNNIANSIIQHPFYHNPESDPNDPDGRLSFTPNPTDLTVIYSRFRIPNYNQSFEESEGQDSSGGLLPSEEAYAIWQGYRQLDETTIDQLANDIVDQIRYRGPFLSLAEFINRRLDSESDPRSQRGAIDAAITASTINDQVIDAAGVDTSLSFSSVQLEDHITDNDFGMISNETAIEGNTSRGVPAYLTQADILQQIGSRLSARSDTFVIRAYGEVLDPFSGKVSASSLCEAVVQRIPDYVDSSQEPYHDDDVTTPEPDNLTDANERFGRKFKIVQLNWLDPSDV